MDHQNGLSTPEPTPPSALAGEGDSHRYERTIDVESESTHARVIELVGRDHRVLELGPSTGYMTELLRDRGCTVVGIEVDPAMAPEAERFSERVIVGDLDELDLEAELGDDRFDVIVAADVLEHLRDPLSLLRRLRPFLSAGGFVVISLPNIAHGSVRLALLEGQFEYRDTGLLDRTHLRFFTRQNIEQMLDDAELAIVTLYRQMLPVGNSEISFDPAAVPAELRDQLDHDPEAQTYQFVLKAIPLETAGLREVQRRMREMAEEIAALRQRAGDQIELETARAQARELRGALIGAHDQLLRRDEQIQRMQQTVEDAEDELLRVQVRLDRILSSPPARAYSALGSIPGLRALKNARTAGYTSAVTRAQADR